MTHLSLFSGIGGLDLAAEMAGFETVGQCEWADYPTKILEKHWPDVPRWRDIRTLTKESFYERTGLRTVDVVSGGFPCQPFSVAGKQRGKDDDRYLWPEMLRVIKEIRPTWVLGENVPGIINLALDTVLSELEGIGYAVQTFNIPAAGVDAPHKRARIAIVGYAEHDGFSAEQELRSDDSASYGRKPEKPKTSGQSARADRSADVPGVCRGICKSERIMADAGSQRLQGQQQHGAFDAGRQAKSHRSACERCEDAADDGSRFVRRHRELSAASETARAGRDFGRRTPEYVAGEWWPTEPNVGRVAHGIPNRVDRIKCLGNAVVPQQFYPFFYYIKMIEDESQ